MKIGIRTPSIKKSFKARTTGKLKRAVKRTYNPIYGEKGAGIVNNPKKAIYNKVYSKVTVDSLESLKKENKQKDKTNKNEIELINNIQEKINSVNNATISSFKYKYPSKEELLKSIPKEKQVKHFDKEAHCCICNKDLGIKTFRSRWQLIDGWLCNDCVKLAGGLGNLKFKGDTVETIKQRIEDNRKSM